MSLHRMHAPEACAVTLLPLAHNCGHKGELMTRRPSTITTMRAGLGRQRSWDRGRKGSREWRRPCATRGIAHATRNGTVALLQRDIRCC